MDQLQAFRDTLTLARDKGMGRLAGGKTSNPLSFEHLRDMLEMCELQQATMPEDKLGRFLGWAQCACVACGLGMTMEDMKLINTRNK